MSIEKTYKFLIRFSLVLLIFLGISLIVQSVIDTDKPVLSHEIHFLSISDKSVDSVISILSIEDKLDIIYQSNQLDSAQILTDLIETQDSVSALKRSGLPNRKNFKINISNLEESATLNSILDTTFLSEYLLHQSFLKDSSVYRIVSLKLDNNDIQNLKDSIYSSFYCKRFNLYSRVLLGNYILFGLNLSNNQLDEISSSKLLVNPYFKAFVSKFYNDLDLIIVDSISEKTSNLPQFDGLLIAKPTSNWMMKDQNLIDIFKSRPDMFLLNKDQIKICKTKTKELLDKKLISELDVNNKIRKTIKAKLWMDLQKKKSINPDNKQLPDEYFTNRLSQLSITLLNNPDSLLPFKFINSKKFTIIWIGKNINDDFKKNCNYYVQANYLQLLPGKNDWLSKVRNTAKTNNCIYVLDTILKAESDISQFNKLIGAMDSKSSVIINFRNYANLKSVPSNIALIQVQSNSRANYMLSAQALFGGISMQAQLPYNFSERYKFGLKKYSPKTRLKYSIPEEAGLDATKLEEIDRIANAAISNGDFPGCQVFVVKNGQVVYDKCFGYQSYLHNQPVSENDMYDLASVTKISATTIATMKMISDGKMSLNDQLGKFFKDTKIDYTRIKPDTIVNIDTFYRSSITDWKKFLKDRDTLNLNDSSFVTIDTVIYRLTPRLNIFKVPLIDLLRHQSGIAPALPIFRYMYYKAYFIKKLKGHLNALHGRTGPMVDFKSFELPENFPENAKLNDTLKNLISLGFKKQYYEYFSNRYVKDSSDIRLTDNLFFKNKYFDTLWHDTKQLPVFGRKVFIYSDINMILLQMAIDSLNRQSIDQFMKKNIYNPLGLSNISYLPLNYFPRDRVIPTEMDNSWRYGYLHGYVHDPSAALLGGMAGNAGLYASAHDLGVLFQMILNKGTYGGIRYINPKIIAQFTTRVEETQRGLGFDMPNRKAKVGNKAPLSTFGHSGFTGTCVWVDPENEIIYIFLSNRNNPSAKNWRINSQMIRERIHNAIYDAMIEKKNVDVRKKPSNL